MSIFLNHRKLCERELHLAAMRALFEREFAFFDATYHRADLTGSEVEALTVEMPVFNNHGYTPEVELSRVFLSDLKPVVMMSRDLAISGGRATVPVFSFFFESPSDAVEFKLKHGGDL